MSGRFTDEEIQRYARHIVLSEIGGHGQEKIRNARVLVVGVGGLGSPAALYLAAAGIGTLGLIDHDRVDLSNLQRQILHFTPDVGTEKTRSAREKLEALNPAVRVDTYAHKLDRDNAREIVGRFDVVVGALDGFEARYVLNDACVMEKVPLVEAGVLRFEGMMTTIVPGEGPCYRCLFPEPPRGEGIPTCAQAGVIGALPGTMGTLQAMEVIKLVTGVGQPLIGRLLMFDALATRFDEVKVDHDRACPVCGDAPWVTVPGEDGHERTPGCQR